MVFLREDCFCDVNGCRHKMAFLKYTFSTTVIFYESIKGTIMICFVINQKMYWHIKRIVVLDYVSRGQRSSPMWSEGQQLEWL